MVNRIPIDINYRNNGVTNFKQNHTIYQQISEMN